MGTAYTVGGSSEGVIPQVMETIFKRIDTLKDKSDFQLRVSFIEVIGGTWLEKL
jgi:kinesin family protein 4/21/27